MNRFSITSLALSLVALSFAGLADKAYSQVTEIRQVIIKRAPVATFKTTEVMTSHLMGQPDFEERLDNINNSINMGLDRGWLTAGQAALFMDRSNRLRDFLSLRSLPVGILDRSSNNEMEKSVNRLSADLSTTMSTRQFAGLSGTH